MGISFECEDVRNPEVGQVVQCSCVIRSYLCDTVAVVGEGELSTESEPFLLGVSVAAQIRYDMTSAKMGFNDNPPEQ